MNASNRNKLLKEISQMVMNRNGFVLRMFLFVAIILNSMDNQSLAQTPSNEPRYSIALKHGSHRLGKRMDADMEKWRNYGLGQFIHWGLYAIPGGFWKGEYYPGAAEWIRSWNKVSPSEYDSLYLEFNPVEYDPVKWAKQAKNMGVKYVIFTTKHHDGFCLWPSKFTNFTVENTPYKKDIVASFVEAYQREGIDVYLYFSIIDWNHPGYRVKIENQEDSLAYEGFKTFTRNQLLELMSMYKGIKGLWFDGTWDSAWKQQAKFADDLGNELRGMSPGLIIGSRFRPDDYGNRHFDSNGDLIGDYEQGWERKLPDNFEETKGVDWDCVMTVPVNQWGYHSDWRGHVKSSTDLLEMLVKSVSLDGNFVLNFGPDELGRIRSEERNIATDIGKWMEKHSNVIYECGYADLKKQDWGYYTKNRYSNAINLVVFNFPVSNKLQIILKNGMKPISAHNNGSKEELSIEHFENHTYFISLDPNINKNEPLVINLVIENE